MPRRPLVAVAPVGEAERGLPATVGPAVAEAFEVEITAAAPMTAPAGAFDRARGQYLSTAFLDVLARAKHRGWERPPCSLAAPPPRPCTSSATPTGSATVADSTLSEPGSFPSTAVVALRPLQIGSFTRKLARPRE